MGSTIEIVVKVKDQASAETAAIAEKIRAEMKAATSGAGGAEIKVPVEPDATGFQKKVQAETRRTGVEPVKVPVDPDASGFAEEVTAKVRRVKPDAVEVPVEVKHGRMESSLREAAAAAEPAAEKAGEGIGNALANGLTRDSQGRLRNAMGRFASDAEKAAAGIDDAGNKADSAGKKVGNSGGGFDLAGLKMAGMVTAAFALAPALAAIPAVAATVAVGAGTMALGLGGVIKALHDYGAASGGAGQSGAQLAATAFSNAVAIRNAEQSIADAKKQSARGAQDSAEQIENAQRGVVDAERQAASAAQSSADSIASAQRGVESSAYSLAQAERQLQDAQKAELDAQKALTQAREDAANQLKDLNNSSADSHLAVERATLSVAKAQENAAKVLGSSLSTDSQKKDAQLSLAEAQQGLIDAQQRSVEASQKADAANKAGINGMQGVVQAQDAVTKGALGVKDAQHGVADATQAQADAQQALARAVQASASQQKSSAESVAKAQQSLADAQRSASRQQQDSAEAVAKAERNLADTYEQQKLAAAAAAASGSAGANAFAKDMANLTPAGQAFVKQLISMRDGAKQLSDTAQTAMLPGLTTMLKDTGPLLPIFNTAVGKMGGIIGDTATAFGNLMQSPAFQGQLAKVLSDGTGLARDFGDGLVNATKGIMKAASDAGPIVSGLGSGIDTLLSKGLPDFFSGLVSNAGGAGEALQGVLDAVSGLLGPLGLLVGGIVGAFGPALKDLVKPLSDFADKVAKGLQPAMGPLSKALDASAKALGQFLVILEPVIPLIAHDLVNALIVLTPILNTLASLLGSNHSWLGKVAAAVYYLVSPVSQLSTAFDLIRDHLGDVGKAFGKFLDFIKRWWPELLAQMTFGVSLIIGHWNSVVDFVKKLPGRLAAAGAAMWSWVGDKIGDAAGSVGRHFDDVLKSVGGWPGKLAKAGAGIWDWIKQEFLGMLNGIAALWSRLRFTTPSFHIPVPFTDGINIDSISVGVAPIGPFKASGGPIAGGLSAIIGDGGWEPLRLPDGTTVVPHANAQQALAEGGMGASGGGGELRLVWENNGAHDELFTWVRRHIRVVAGSGPDSVQKALGQSF